MSNFRKLERILENPFYKLQDTESVQKSYPINKQSMSFVSNQTKCQFCSNSHKTLNCPNFLELNVNKRTKEIKKLKFCLNCFHHGHKYLLQVWW